MVRPMRIQSRPGHYVIGDHLASGGTAMLFRGLLCGPRGFKRPVTIKRLLPPFENHPDYVKLLRNEARLYGGLAHPNILQIYDYMELDGSPCLILEPITGADLRNILLRLSKKGEKLSAAAALFIASEICHALQYLHKRAVKTGEIAIVHRDLAPDNALISTEGQVKLADFGTAVKIPKGRPTPTPDRWGKPAYCAPEQISGGKIDERSDIYALGLLLRDLAERTAPEAAEILNTVADKCCMESPADRYQSCDEILEAISSYSVSKDAAVSGRNDLKAVVATHLSESTAFVISHQSEPTKRMAVTAMMPLKKEERSIMVSAFGAILLSILLLASFIYASKLISPPKAAGSSEINIVSTAPGTVYVNGRRIGKPPIKNFSIPAGTYRISFRPENKEKLIERMVILKSGQNAFITIGLERMDIE